jgi:hypothetical protein
MMRGSAVVVVVACVGCFATPPSVDEDDDGASSDAGEPAPTMGPLVPRSTFDDGAIFPGPYGTEWFPKGEDMLGCGYAGEAPMSRQYYAYVRFELPEALPADTVIEDAVLVLVGHTTFSWVASDALRVWVQESSDAPDVGGVEDYPGESVVLSAVSVRWPPEHGLAWQHPGTNRSPDLSALLQHLVDANGGLAAGAHVQLWFAADEIDGFGTEVGWLDSSAGTDTAPSLSITRAPGA